MSVTQISVFVQSEPGHLSKVLSAFDEANVNVRGYSAADTGDFGIVRFVVDDPERALGVLRDMGCAATEKQVLVARLDDRPGELARIMGAFAAAGINVEYSYSLIGTFIAVSVADLPAAEAALSGQLIDLVGLADVAPAIPAGGRAGV